MSVLDQQLPERETHARLAPPRRSMWHLHTGVRTGDRLTIGERAADRMRNGMGSWPFVFLFLAAMAIWMMINSLFKIGHPFSSGTAGFDPYPYILLNLVLSTLAGLQAAALLIAAKRADAISSEIAVHTLSNTESDRKLLQENTELTKQVHELQVTMSHQTALLDEIHRHVGALSPEAGQFPPPPAPPAKQD
jgi:uncharacterized membrane protein